MERSQLVTAAAPEAPSQTERDDGDAWLGKGRDAVAAWLRTFRLILTDRRALLSTAPRDEAAPMSPIAFLLGIVGVSLVLDRALYPQPPAVELPDLVQAVVTATSTIEDPNSLYFVLLTGLTAVVFWMCFRAMLIPLRFRAALRHSSFNLGAYLGVATVLSLIGGVWRLTGHAVPAGLAAAGFVVDRAWYAWLLVFALRQVADEGGVGVWRALPPFVAGWLVVTVILFEAGRYGPENWVSTRGAMAPAVEAGDRVQIDRWIVGAREPEPGEVVEVKGRRGGMADGLDFLARVLALPGDSVSETGPDLVVNGETLPRTPIRSPRQRHDPAMMPFRSQVEEQRFVVQYGPGSRPLPCLAARETVVPAGQMLVAWDTRRDGAVFCAVVDRGRAIGVASWNGRTRRKP